MDGLNKIDDQWIPLQVKVFSRWVSSKLQGHSDTKVEDITKDLSNGVALCDLATYLTHKNAPRAWSHEPKRTVDMVQNCELAVDMFDKDGVRLVGISGKDINDNNQKLILGLVWSLILHYQIGQSFDIDNSNSKENTQDVSAKASAKNQKDALLSWASERTANYPNIHNFQPFDLSLCALLDTYVPEKINYYKLDPNDSKHNSELATNVMHDLGIPVFVYPEELQKHNNIVDEKTLLTQLSTAKVILDKRPKEDLSHLLAAEEASKLADEAAADAEDGVQYDDYNDEDDAASHPEESDQDIGEVQPSNKEGQESEPGSNEDELNGPTPTNTENPEWVIDDDASQINNLENPENPDWTNNNSTDALPIGKQSTTCDSLIDLSVVPQPQNKNASILASSAEWVTNDGINNPAIAARPAESAQNLIEFSADSEEQQNGESTDVADSKIIQDRNAPATTAEPNQTQADDLDSSEDYTDAVLVWENKNIDTETESGPQNWIIGDDDDGDTILLPDDHPWELESESGNGIVAYDNQPWLLKEGENPMQQENETENEALDWIVVDENAPAVQPNDENGKENIEPTWVIENPSDSYNLPEPDVHRWEIDDATAEAVKVRMAEESLEEQILSREVSFPDPNEHGTQEENGETADYSSHFMFIDAKSWF